MRRSSYTERKKITNYPAAVFKLICYYSSCSHFVLAVKG